MMAVYKIKGLEFLTWKRSMLSSSVILMQVIDQIIVKFYWLKIFWYVVNILNQFSCEC